MRSRHLSSRGRLAWLLHRMVASYWGLPVLGALAAMPLLLAMLHLDRSGLAAWLLANDLNPVETADTAKDLVAVAIGIGTAFTTLYFSITLLVLTVASSNLGVRLIDRWLEKRLVRAALTVLVFALVFALGAMAAVDGEAELADVPLATVGAVLLQQIGVVALLTIALHDLGRTVFVDRSIAYLGRDAARDEVIVAAGAPHAGECRQIVRARDDGYVEGNDLVALRRLVGDSNSHVRVLAAPGRYVLAGDPLIALEHPVADERRMLDAVPVGPHRGDVEGVGFRVRLLVEIAARALSPAVNDLYTGRAAADRLAAAMLSHAAAWVDADKAPVWREDARFELPGQDFRAVFAGPLTAFRQSACQYPSIAIRMIGLYARVADKLVERGQSDECIAFLRDCACELAEHAGNVADHGGDREAITAAFARGFPKADRV
ncbi:DUF2254 family protein [Sphingomonas baiyangensis]|uniref:DUF2254 domain-containing protein n=1 Tax=Sphingomonas baiyangensis TaxID=2572576 RepID=A0A4U1L079_9SPHN|nr:DUF2254 family protein [Sphingomonas baiyangensis]TKD50119.1 DUF2254 domain-containing protein [Sphingomonas baiyangensis]